MNLPRTRRIAAVLAATGAALMMIAPAKAQILPPQNYGTGVVDVLVTADAGKGIPMSAVPPPCGSTPNESFTFSGTSTAVAYNTRGSSFIGNFPTNGYGSDLCASAMFENLLGTTFHVNAFNTTYQIAPGASSTLDCASGLTGNYVRVGTVLAIVMNGTCVVSGQSGSAIFLSTGHATPAVPSEVPLPPGSYPVPTGGGDGFSTPITTVKFDGSWAILL